MRKIILILAVVFTTSILITSCKSEKKEAKKEQTSTDKKDVYQCPMKCEKEKTYDKEGKCPVCEMKLRKKTLENQENHEH